METTNKVFVIEGGAVAKTSPFLQNASGVTASVAQKALANQRGREVVVAPGYAYLGGDLMALPREATSLSNAIHGRPDGAGVHLFGLTAIFSLFTGAISGKRGYDQYETASKINDVVGQGLGVVNMARAPAEILGGLTFTAFRGVSIAGTFTSSAALGAAQTVLSGLGSAFFVLTYALLAVPSAVTLYKNISFGRKLSAAMDGAEGDIEKAKAGLRVLMEEVTGTEAERKEFLKKVLGEIDEKALINEELTFFESEAEHFVHFKGEKFAEFERKAGAKTLAFVRSELAKDPAERLIARLEKNEEGDLKEANEVIEEARGEILKNRILHVAIVAFCVLGVAALILGNIFTGGLLGTMIIASWILVSIGMLAIDGYLLYQALKNGEMENSDKIAMFVMNALMITLAGATVFLSGGTALIVAGVILGTAFAGTSLYLALSSGDDDDAEDLAADATFKERQQERRGADLDPIYQVI